jgi:hypothetical protein
MNARAGARYRSHGNAQLWPGLGGVLVLVRSGRLPGGQRRRSFFVQRRTLEIAGEMPVLMECVARVRRREPVGLSAPHRLLAITFSSAALTAMVASLSSQV